MAKAPVNNDDEQAFIIGIVAVAFFMPVGATALWGFGWGLLVAIIETTIVAGYIIIQNETEITEEQKPLPTHINDTPFTSGKQQDGWMNIPTDEEFTAQGWRVGDWFTHRTLVMARQVPNGDWETARMALQKAAYEIHKAGIQPQLDWFKCYMSQFVANDPIYTDTINNLKKAIQDNPGLTQSSIYKQRSDTEKELARYVIYFAHELGDIYRVKAGNTYRLYLSKSQHQAITAQS